LSVHVRGPGEPYADWRADAASGNGPYEEGTSSTPWRDVASHYDAVLPAQSAPQWLGDGSTDSPVRLQFGPATDPVALASPDAVHELAAAGPLSAEVWLETGADVVRTQTILEWFEADAAPWPGVALGLESGHLRVWGSPWRSAGDVEPLHWYHLVLEQSANSLELYVNGVLAHADDAPVPGAQHSTLDLGASRRGGVVAERMEGAVGAARLYDEMLSASQVRTTFLADSAKFLGTGATAPVTALVLAADSASGSGPPVVPGTASPWRDLSGGAHDGALEGFTAANDTSGWAGDATTGSPWRLELDGVDDDVRIAAGSVAALQSPAAASMAMWVRPAATLAREQGLLEWNAGDASRSGLALELLSGRLRLWTGSGWADAAGVTPGVWHHVAVAKSSTVASVWLDGRPVWRGFSPVLGTQTSALVIGGLLPVVSGPVTNRLRGAIARVEVASGTFGDGDVMARYQSQDAPYLHVMRASGAQPSCLGGSRTIVQVPVVFDRVGTTGALGYSVTLQWSAELARNGSVIEGPFLSGPAPTFVQVVDGPNRTCTVDVVRLGQGCSAPSSGELFRLPLSATIASGNGTVRVLSATLRDCDNHSLPLDVGDAIGIPIQGTGPPPVTGLTAVALSETGAETHGVRFSFVAPADAESVTVYRAAFGGYPEYDDASGVAPPAPTSDPPPASWQRLNVHDTGHTDFSATRDAWSYVAFAWDSCGNRSAASAVTPLTVNYVLGDVRGGAGACTGDGAVGALDLAPLVAHYLAQPANGDSLACLDVGPTVDGRLDGRPVTDDRVNFEDLMLLALNHGAFGSGGAISGVDSVSLRYVPSGTVGDTFTVFVKASGSGLFHGITAALTWDPAILAFESVAPGPLLAAQGLSSVVLSPAGNRLDVALLGQGRGLYGAGTLATMVFRRVGPGEPVIAFTSIHGRTATNADQPVPIGITFVAAPPRTVTALALSEAMPNPFHERAVFVLDMPRAGPASLQVYDLLGRRVRTLVDRALPAGAHRVTWDGRDGGGNVTAPGVYFARLWTPQGARLRRVVRL
jgi:hypothetical protein